MGQDRARGGEGRGARSEGARIAKVLPMEFEVIIGVTRANLEREQRCPSNEECRSFWYQHRGVLVHLIGTNTHIQTRISE